MGQLRPRHGESEPADFITIHPDSDTRLYGSGFLPAAHQGTKVTVPQDAKQSPIDYLADISGDAKSQRARIDFTQRMNRRLLDQAPGDARMEGMIESMEIAFRMQTATPELMDISSESEATKKLYGVGNKDCDKNVRACLLARRLSEAGVRFVQVIMGGWDHHGDICTALPKSCAGTDQPCAALIKDLAFEMLMNVPEEELTEMVKDKTQPKSLRIVGKAMLTAKGWDVLQSMMDRVHGKPKATHEHTGTVTVPSVTINVPPLPDGGPVP